MIRMAICLLTGPTSGHRAPKVWSCWSVIICAAVFLTQVAEAQSFVNVALTLGVAGQTTEDTYNASWIDYDGDGDDDLHVIHKFFVVPDDLYRNDGGSFTDVSSMIPTVGADNGGGGSATWVDYDNDGDLDLYRVAPNGAVSVLYRNDGTGFTNVASSAGIEGDTSWGERSVGSWADFDNDGWVDLFMPGTPCRLFKNDRDGTFTDVAGTIGVTLPTSLVRAGVWGDYDDDGDQDLYVFRANGNPVSLYRNEGNGTFSDVTSSAGVASTGNTSTAVWIDVDNDSDLDLMVYAWRSTNLLYMNQGNGTFMEEAAARGLTVENAGGAHWADYDGDGDQDFFSAGHVAVNQFFENDGTGHFTEKAADLGLQDGTGKKIGGAWGDYDGDGDLDLYVSNRTPGPNRLYRNDVANGQSWLQVGLTGTISNRSAVGARVTIVAGATRQIREITAQSAGSAQSTFVAAFGLGADSIVDSLIIRWPSGVMWDTTNVEVNQRLDLIEREPNHQPRANAGPDMSISCGFGTTEVQLDGSESTDPDDDQLSYMWEGSFGTATGETPTVDLPVGIHSITLTVDDNHGGSDSDDVIVTIIADATPPTLEVPNEPLTVEAQGPLGTSSSVIDAFLLSAEAQDDCDPSPVVTVMPPAGSVFPLGPTTVMWQAVDRSGNTSTGEQTIHVVDTTPPDVALDLDVHELWPPNHKLHEIGITVSVDDIADATVSVTATAFSSEADDAKGKGDGKSTGDVRAVTPEGESIQSSNETPEVTFDPMLDQLYLRAERAGGRDARYYVVTAVATDGSGNRATVRDSVFVAHDNRAGKRIATAPARYELLPNAPNPFNPSTLIRFVLPEEAEIRLELFDSLGRSVRVVRAGVFPAGFHAAEWNGTDESGYPVASGIYFARIKAGEYHAVRRMLLLR